MIDPEDEVILYQNKHINTGSENEEPNIKEQCEKFIKIIKENLGKKKADQISEKVQNIY